MNHGSTAMQCPPTPGPGLQDVDPRDGDWRVDDIPDVEAELVADQRQLVGERDVDVAGGILDQLDQLGGRARRCVKQLALQEDAVEAPRRARRTPR